MTHAPQAAPLPAPAARTGRLVALASGKGGVGKTVLAIALAHAAARAGRSVLLFDADLGLANIDVQLGLSPARDLHHAFADGSTLSAAAQFFAPGGFSIVAGRSGATGLTALPPPEQGRLVALLTAETLRHDLVIADLGAGIDPATRRLAAAAHTLLVIATDEPTSLTDAYAVLKLHHADAPGADRRILVNQAASRAAGDRTYQALTRATSSFLGFTPRLAGIIRRDPAIPAAIRAQTPLLTRSPQSPAAQDIEALAQSLRNDRH